MIYNEVLKLRQDHFPKNLALFYSKPLRLVKGEYQYLYTDENIKYLDGYNNVAHVGHCHPRLANVAFKNLSTLNTNTRYLHENIVILAEKLVSLMPKTLKVCVFVNSGSEANDLALRMANYHSNKKGVVCMEYAYHGSLSSLLPISEYKYQNDLRYLQDHVYKASLPHQYQKPDQNVQYFANEMEQICQKMIKNGHGVGTYIHESFPSCGGQLEFPEGYLQEMYKIIRKYGGTCIADEVQTGFGRIGNEWWSFQDQGVIPDIVTIGKPFGNGFPLAAVVCTQEVADSFNNGMEYFNTFAGSQMACGIGLEVINIVIDEKLKENAYETGIYLKQQLLKLKEKYDIIGDVRGKGFMLGIELVKDRKTKKEATTETKYIVDEMKNNFVLVGTDGKYNNVIKIKPPMCFNKENCDTLVDALEKSIKKFYQTQSKL